LVLNRNCVVTKGMISPFKFEIDGCMHLLRHCVRREILQILGGKLVTAHSIARWRASKVPF
jgi:hypothetical protein